MRRRALCTAMALCASWMLADVGQASGAVTHSTTYVDTYLVTLGGTSTMMPVYQFRLDAGAGRTIASLEIEFGPMVSANSAPLFQAAWMSGGKTPTIHLTPTKDDAESYLLPLDATKCYEADSHFLSDVYDSGWLSTPVVPTETNDGSLYSPPTPEDYYAGYGSLYCDVEIPVEDRKQSMDVARIGALWFLSGPQLAYHYRAVDDVGQVTEVWVPEPGTACLMLVGGCLAVYRRGKRRSVATP